MGELIKLRQAQTLLGTCRNIARRAKPRPLYRQRILALDLTPIMYRGVLAAKDPAGNVLFLSDGMRAEIARMVMEGIFREAC